MHLSLECMVPRQCSNLESFIFITYRKEDLGMYGNELNYMQTCWTIGYVIGEIPSNILLTRIKPRYWIPAMEVRRFAFVYARAVYLHRNSSSGRSSQCRCPGVTPLLNSMF